MSKISFSLNFQIINQSHKEMDSKNLLFIILAFLQTFVFLAYSLPLPIYPELALSKNITKDLIGFIFACYPITHLMTSFIFGKMMMQWDRKNVVLYCILLLVIATIVFGIVDLIDSPPIFVCLSVVSRLLQGCGVAGYNVVCFAIFPKLYPESLQEKLGYFAVACGMGISLGPIIGGVLYSLMNYEFVFFSVAGVYFILLIYLKRNLDFSDLQQDDPNETDKIPENPADIIGYCTFFKSFQFILTIFSQIFSIVAVAMLFPTLGDRIFLLGGNTLSIALAFAVNTLSYSGIVLISNYFSLTQRFNRRLSISIGFLMVVGGVYMISDTNSLELIIVAMGIMGFGHFFVLLPIIPELIAIGQTFKSNSPKKNDVINDLSAALFNAAFGFTEFVGPLIGGVLDVNFGFSYGIYIYFVVILVFWVIYLILGGGLKAIKTPCVKPTEMEKEDQTNTGLLVVYRSTPSQKSSFIKRSLRNSNQNSMINSPSSQTGTKKLEYLQEVQQKLLLEA